MTSIVAVDIETTGLDPNRDSIIEIGAVLFNERRVEAEWSSLINPEQIIPSHITALTGISNEMVRNAPNIYEVINDFTHFVGDTPVLGHNIRFDLSFLRQENILRYNEAIDTYELAAVLIPRASRYNLKALGQDLGILFPATHRALDDARVTHAVFMKLWEMARDLPNLLIAELVRLSEAFDWGGNWLFHQILQENKFSSITDHKAYDPDYSQFIKKYGEMVFPPLSPVEPPVELDIEEIASFLDYGGKFSSYFESYEHRPEQLEMLRAISNALSYGQHLMVEAGTGVGKSFAYLVPAALWASRNQQRVVISTNTINLQDQLIHKDIPDLCNALGINLLATVLKGRSNYLCPRKLDILRQRGPESIEQLRVLGKVLIWLHEGGNGDRNEINLNGPVEREIWNRMSAEDEACRAETCMQRVSGYCPFFLNRQISQNAHLIIVNHALLLADVATGNRVIPDYQHLIIDEAHHIESATTNALTFRVTQGEIIRLLKEVGGTSSGFLGFLLVSLRDQVKPSEFAAVHSNINQISELIFRLENDFKSFFHILEEFLQEQRENRPVSVYGQQVRIIPSTLTLPIWSNVEIAWDSLRDTINLVIQKLQKLHQTAGDVEHAGEELYGLIESLAGVKQRFIEIEQNLTSMVSDPDPERIFWLEISPQGFSISINIAPLQIGPLMEKYLWHEKESVILTSATLTTHEGFDYMINRLYADEADVLALGSPFDYETSALLYVVNDIPEPGNGMEYQKAVERTLVRLAKSVGGRMLVLFTSYAQLKRTSQNITSQLYDSDITIYEQGEGASPNTLLEYFKTSEKAVLLGTRSFWEGVDIPGEALSVLVIVKLPFDVPSDPIIAARSEMYEDSFHEYNLPEAILRFRQGFGRLIRTQSDRGVVVLLDRRILTKRYGKSFIDSLPECTKQIGPMRDLPRNAAKWLNI